LLPVKHLDCGHAQVLAHLPCIQENPMTQFTVTIDDNESSHDLANNEESYISDEHWAVIMYLRQHYLALGQPRHAPLRPGNPNKKFFTQGRNKYLRLLFACEPVTKGSHVVSPPTIGKRNR